MALLSNLRDIVTCKCGRVFSRHGRGYILAYVAALALIIYVIQYQRRQVREAEIHWRSVTTECHAMIRQNPLISHFRKLHHEEHLHHIVHQKRAADLEGDELCRAYKDASKAKHKVIPNILEAVVHKHSFLVAYVTQLSSDRLDRLHEAINHWTGPVSAAIYVKHEHLREIDRLICGYPLFVHRRDVFLHLVPENGQLYPINFLRNVALHHAATDYVFLADVDFVPMPGIHNRLLSNILKVPKHHKQALIVPAFEVLQGMQITPHNKPYSKADLLQLWDNGIVEPFHFTGFFHGHKPTNFSHWREVSSAYDVHWQRWFEPYVVVKKKEIPTFHEQFVERGFDKSSFIMHLAALKFNFVVMPDVFMLHTPHHEDNVEFYQTQKLHRCAKEAFEHVRQELAKKHNFHEHFHMSEFGQLSE